MNCVEFDELCRRWIDSGRNAKNGATPEVIPGQPQGQRISRTKKVVMETSALTQSRVHTVTPRLLANSETS